MEYESDVSDVYHATKSAAPTDPIETSLRGIAQNIFIGAFGLLPLIFIPAVYAPFDYTKTIFVVLAVLIATIFFSLSILRSGVVRFAFSWPLVALLLTALTSFIAALLSGDMYDALIGDTFAIHTTLFLALICMIVLLVTLFGQNKAFLMPVYVALTGSAVVLGLYHISRILFGPGFLAFGVFTSNTSSLLGSWNDLALFFGLTILLALVALEQLPLTKWGRILFSVVVAVSLLMLAIVNFFAVWIILALVSLVVLMYALTKDKLLAQPTAIRTEQYVAFSSVMVSAVVFVCSLIFVIGGTVVGGAVSKMTGVSYVEVRPSLTATIDIARHVYGENALVGIGPNKFIDAWRLYKDSSLNQTIFWATDFMSGSGFVTTQFVTTGILGALAWISFLVLFLWYGLRMLFKTTYADRFWYFIGTSSFVAACYLWIMACIYTPSATILLITALFTGMTFASGAALSKERVFVWSIEQNRRAGFVVVGMVMLVIIGAASSLYYVGRHYAAVYVVSGAVSGQDGSTSIEAVEQKIASSFLTVPSDQFARQLALYQLAKMNALMAIKTPSAVEQQEFQRAAATGINAAQQAIALDASDAQNYSTLGTLYLLLAAAGVEGAPERATEAFTAARARDPINPSYALLEAQLAARTGKVVDARTHAADAIALKANYTDALFFLTQLDVSEGKVAEAITTTRSIISYEPNNPARYYQLGVLLSADKNIDDAMIAFKQAVTLNPSYANAHYFLALGYLEKGDRAAALAELKVVATLDPNNTEIASMISKVEKGEIPSGSTLPENPAIQETTGVTTNGDTVTTDTAPDTSLIVPVNPVGEATNAGTPE